MPLHAVHHDVETGLGRKVDEAYQLVDGGRADEGAVGLEQRPEVEDADVVQAEAGYLGQVLAGVVRVEVVPGVEPAAAGRVVDAEAELWNGILLGPGPVPGRDSSVGRGLSSLNVSTTMVGNE
jgi:hypothetical protein